MWKWISVSVIVLWCSEFPSHAQIDCEQVLNNATEEFNAGHFYGISAMLKPCIDNGFSREQRQRAYLLLTQVYLLLDDPIGAEDSYLKLLHANPEFVAEPDREPIDVVYLGRKFTSAPVLTMFGKIGINTTFERIINDWKISGSGERQQCIIKPGWQLHGGMDWNLQRKFALSLSVGYSLTAFKKEVTGIFINDATEIFDREHWFTIPVSFKYTHPGSGSLKPYGYIGYSANLLLGARASLIKSDRTPDPETGEFSEERSESPTLRFTERRNFLNQSLIAGCGVKYKVGLNYIFIDLNYTFGFSNIANKKTRYFDYSLSAAGDHTSDDLINSGISGFEFAHVDDDFRIDNLAFSFGYAKPLYKPRRTKSYSRSGLRIFKRKR